MPTQLVLRLLLDAPEQEAYGLDVIKGTELPPGTVYPLLQRLEQAGWVTARWEEDPSDERRGRPRRRYYRLTRDGAARATNALAEASRKRAPVLSRLLRLERTSSPVEEG
ncbi:PadR family transcriptional regulator [Saccharothrix xinjiangensis]